MRSNLAYPYCEYYPFGHDVSESALSGLKLPKKTRFDVLYGGVGDGRHVLHTILEAHYRNVVKKEELTLHVSMNDINATLLLKDILVLVVLHRIGSSKSIDMRSENIVKDLGNDKDIFILMAVLYYGTLSYSMPPSIYCKLQSVLKEIFLESSCAEFHTKYPWYHLPESSWDSLVHVAKHWADISMYEPPLKSLKECLGIHRPKSDEDKFDGMMEKLEAMGAPASQINEFKRMKAEREAQTRLVVSQGVDDILSGNSSIPFPDFFSEFIPENGSKDEIEKGKQELIDHMVQMELEGGGELEIDSKFQEETNTILPVANAGITEMKREVEMLEMINEAQKEGHLATGLKKAKALIHKEWKVNPMKFCPNWNEFYQPEINDADVTNHVKEFPSYYFHDGIFDFLFRKGDRNPKEMLYRKTLFDIFALFYANASIAIATLVEKNQLSLEISLASIFDYATDISNEKDRRLQFGLPVSFNEVFLSNVPDYTGMLPAFVQITPILKRTTEGSPSNFRSNVLLNTGIFKSYDEYTNASTALSVKDISRILKVKSLESPPDVWNGFNRWTLASSRHHLTYIEFKTWIHKLFLKTVVPPARDSSKSVREEHPNTCALFLSTCKHCIEYLEYPVHWVMNSIERLLVPEGKLKTKATIVNQSPSAPLVDGKKLKVYNISAFQEDLRNELSIFMKQGLLPRVCTLSSKLANGEVSEYILDVTIDEDQFTGNQNISCIGFLLQKELNDDFEIRSLGGFFMMFGNSSPKPLEDLREALLKKGDVVGHLLSTTRYNIKKHQLSFTMCNDIYEKWGEYFVSIVRTDCWGTVKHERIRLKEGRKVSSD